jgi:transcriptional regulator with XRE-family HTH domain
VFDVGASLAAAREARGYSLADAERLTHIRVKYLSALERDDFDTLPGRTYARAFLRTYANALGLEADKFVVAFEELVPEPVDELIALPEPSRRRSIGLGSLLGLVAVAGVAGIVAWTSTSGTPRKLPPASPLRTPVTHHAVGVLGVRHTGAKAQHAAVVQHPSRTLVIRAVRGDCWLQVRRGGASGAIVYQGMLHLGGMLRFGSPNLWLRLGAPGMVEISRGGKTLGGLTGVTPVNVAA